MRGRKYLREKVNILEAEETPSKESMNSIKMNYFLYNLQKNKNLETGWERATLPGLRSEQDSGRRKRVMEYQQAEHSPWSPRKCFQR